MERTTHASPLSWTFLGIVIAGSVVPLATFLLWLMQHGLDVPRLVDELFSSRVGAFFAWDVVIAALAVLVATALVPGIPAGQRIVVGAGTLMIGVSCGLPLLLFFWSRAGVMR
ncbi:MAG: DUF2834 domain-containing protein [Chloroflexota bacterium]|nr:DUF2834 domain-containing protein [Chloroflexota bacterium]